MVIRGLLLSMQEEKNQLISSVLLQKFRTGRVWSLGGFQGSNENGFYLFFFLSLDHHSLSHQLPKLKPQCDRVCNRSTKYYSSLSEVLLCPSDVRPDCVICFGQGNVSRSNLCHVREQALGASVPNEGCASSLGLRLKAAWDGAVVELG